MRSKLTVAAVTWVALLIASAWLLGWTTHHASGWRVFQSPTLAFLVGAQLARRQARIDFWEWGPQLLLALITMLGLIRVTQVDVALIELTVAGGLAGAMTPLLVQLCRSRAANPASAT